MISRWEKSLALQADLDRPQSDSERQATASNGLLAINARWDPEPVRATHALAAYFVDDRLTQESLLYPMQVFGEVILKGHIPRVSYIDIGGRLVVSLPFFNAIVMGPSQDIEAGLVDYELEGSYELEACDTVLPLNTPLKRPLYTPVEAIQLVIYAA